MVSWSKRMRPSCDPRAGGLGSLAAERREVNCTKLSVLLVNLNLRKSKPNRLKSSSGSRSGDGGIDEPSLGETLRAEPAGVAAAARTAAAAGVVAGAGQREVEAEDRRAARSRPWSSRAAERGSRNQRALDPRLRPEPERALEGLEKFGPAVRVAGVVEHVGAEEDDAGADRLAEARRRARGKGCCGPERTSAGFGPLRGLRRAGPPRRVGERRGVGLGKVDPHARDATPRRSARRSLAPARARRRAAARTRTRARGLRSPRNAR